MSEETTTNPTPMRLRAEPPRVTRLSRKMLAGAGAVALLGIGGALIGAIQADAAARGCDVALHVLAGNHAARRLYERLGFAVQDGGDGVHLPMRWCAPAAGQLKTAS